MATTMRRVRFDHLLLHGLRLGLCALALEARLPTWATVPFAAALFFTAFSVAHDATHGSLGLPRRVNTIVLSLSALLMLVSGHAMRRMHLLHHARTLPDADLEGRGARLPAVAALLGGPANALALRLAAFRGARRRERVVQAVETIAGVALVALAVWTRHVPLLVHVTVALALQASMALWASHVPHHTPARVVEACKRLGFLRSPTLLSLAYHDLHHRRPGVPCQDLAIVAPPLRSACAERGSGQLLPATRANERRRFSPGDSSSTLGA